MKRILFFVFVGVYVLALACGNVWAQATAQISGTVRDQTGAVLPGNLQISFSVATSHTRTGCLIPGPALTAARSRPSGL